MLANGAIDNGVADYIIIGIDNSIGMNLQASTCTNIGVLIDDVATKVMYCSQVMPVHTQIKLIVYSLQVIACVCSGYIIIHSSYTSCAQL